MEYCDKHEELAGDLRETRAMVKEVHAGLLGNIKPNGGEGLIAKVNRHEQSLRALCRLNWTLVTAIIGSIVMAIVRAVV